MSLPIQLSVFYAACLIGQTPAPADDVVGLQKQTTTVCVEPSASACADEVALQVPLGKQNESVMRQLERESELDMTGHPAPLGGLVVYLSGDYLEGWNLPTFVDKPALAKHGIRLDDICPYWELRAGGVSRRSSLRFILDAGGVAFYVDDAKLVVTTKHIARVKWLEQLEKPEPKALGAAAVDKRRETAFAAGFWQLDPDVWVEPLAKALNDNDRQVGFDAAYALGELGPLAEKAIDPLVSLLRSKDLRLREAAVFALGKIGSRSTKRLLELIDDPDSEIALAAAKSFKVMGSVGKAAVPKLIEAGKRHASNSELCDSIGSAIAVNDSEQAVPELRKLLKSDSEGIRSFAANAIGEIGPPGQPCAKDLLPLLTDQSLRVRIDTAHALARLDLPDDFPTTELEAAAKDPDRHVSLWAQAALRVIRSNK